MLRSRLGSAILAVVGLVMLGITGVINFRFGHTLAMSGEDATIQAVSGLAIDILGAVLATVCVYFWTRGHRTWGFVIGVVVAGCMTYSVASVIGFGAANRIQMSETAQAQAKAQAEAARLRTQKTLERQDSAMAWLQGTYAKAGEKGEKKTLVEAVTSMAAKPVEIEAEPVAPQLADAQASVLAGFIGWKVQSAQMALLATLAILLKLGEVLCFGAASAMWPSRARADASRDTPEMSGLQPLTDGRTYGLNVGHEHNKEKQGLSKNDVQHVGHKSGHLRTRPHTEARVSDVPDMPQLVLGLSWDEAAARKDWEGMHPEVRGLMSKRALAARWDKNEKTVRRWTRSWEAEKALADMDRSDSRQLRVIEGGGT